MHEPTISFSIHEDKEKEMKEILTAERKNDANFIEPGHKYEMLYYDNRWISLGMHIARCDSLVYEIPANSLTLVRDLTAGKEERPFTYREHTPQWW